MEVAYPSQKIPTAVAKAAITLKTARMMVELRIDFAAWKRNWLMRADVEPFWALKGPRSEESTAPLTLPVVTPSASARVHRLSPWGSVQPQLSISSIVHLALVEEMIAGV